MCKSLQKCFYINGNCYSKTGDKKKLPDKSTIEAICKELNSISDKLYVEYCNATLRKFKNKGENWENEM
jgi:hypothetical protein